MHSLYNRVAGQNVERLAALSDGIFAVAMTLLVLDLHVPASSTVHSERDLWHVLLPLAPRLVIFMMSVMTLGIFWVGQQTQVNHFARADRNLSWIHIFFLCAVSLIPFSTALLAEYIHFRTALLIYWANILLLGLTLYWSWGYATRNKLLADDAPREIHRAVVRRIAIAQGYRVDVFGEHSVEGDSRRSSQHGLDLIRVASWRARHDDAVGSVSPECGQMFVLAVLVFFVKQQDDGKASPPGFQLNLLNRLAEEGVVDLGNDDSNGPGRRSTQGSRCFVRRIAKMLNGSGDSQSCVGPNADASEVSRYRGGAHICHPCHVCYGRSALHGGHRIVFSPLEHFS